MYLRLGTFQTLKRDAFAAQFHYESEGFFKESEGFFRRALGLYTHKFPKHCAASLMDRLELHF